MVLYSLKTQPYSSGIQYNSSLLFQFIMSEFLQSVNALNHAKKNVTLTTTELSQLANSLCGYTSNPLRLFLWNEETGSLSKLRNYCAIFIQTNEPGEKYMASLEKHSTQAWLMSLELAEHSAQTSETQLNSTLTKLQTVLNKIGQSIAKLIPQFRDDENVLYFILRHYATFDQCYKKGFTLTTFKSLFKNGLSETGQFLIKKYSLRGFKTLVPKIQECLEHLKK